MYKMYTDDDLGKL